MNAGPHIRILMCTYNGAAFLAEQLKSIANQTHSDWSLWVSDDGSSDETLEILERFKQNRPPNRVEILNGPQQGASANYLSLITKQETAANTLFALSDQDDVWMQDKLERAVQALSGLEHECTAYATSQIISDSTLTHHRPGKPCPAGPSFLNALVQNILSGSTLVLNANAMHLIQRGMPKTPVPFHDWWIYQIITGAGGTAIYDPNPSVHYRQHGGNLLGGNRGRNAVLRRLKLLGKSNFSDWIDQNVAALLDAKPLLTDENRAILAAFIEARKKPRRIRAAALRKIGIKRQSRKETAALLGAATLGRL